ncbi:MAG: hypothetical protein Q7T16_04575 [Candidatus Burarchaeum sp.]|nr:hypothetical protein [Candidatus Burarchaeum sp.]MDO8339903.1 hypothetical protein [Candidatus Burarchaeum sp.]
MELRPRCSMCGTEGVHPGFENACSPGCSRAAILRSEIEGLHHVLDDMAGTLCEIRNELEKLNSKKKV